MIKYFCNKCGKEVKEINQIFDTEHAKDRLGRNIAFLKATEIHLCNECYKKFKQLHLDIGEFLKFSDEELDFLLNTFKVGDQVITDDGRIGRIIDICTCDKCEERGFYEPEVRYINGDTDYITISDKNNEFKNFYSIGNKVFGNLDEAHLLSCISARREELRKLEAQLDVINQLKNK